MNWFSADYHFNHKNIIEFCGRPFEDITEMNKAIKERHNSRVKRGDTVYFLGDFVFGASKIEIRRLIESLNGDFVFIEGNHDRKNKSKSMLKKAEIEGFGKRIQLVHRPQDIDEGYDFYLCGHVHEHWRFKENICNVGVDVWDFYPVHMKQILKAYKRWRKDGDNREGIRRERSSGWAGL
ncbi:MAG: metallophosphoesterase family protein [Thermotogota bacterium]|nr:metallophosphoesterase family protein [Thermotogota bacterium]